jgi:hypothetical protein
MPRDVRPPVERADAGTARVRSTSKVADPNARAKKAVIMTPW